MRLGMWVSGAASDHNNHCDMVLSMVTKLEMHVVILASVSVTYAFGFIQKTTAPGVTRG
jgi:hypothetical protein